MRNVIGLSVVLLMCLVLSSCASSPEKAFMGTWKGTHEGEAFELSFMEKGIWIVKAPDETTAGTWSIDPDGNAQMSYDEGKGVATLAGDKKMVVREEGGSDAVVLEKADAKKK